MITFNARPVLAKAVSGNIRTPEAVEKKIKRDESSNLKIDSYL